ncbi:MAG: glutathione S-transferase family protein [Pseudomonadota bacterium]
MSEEVTFYTNPHSRGRIVRWMLEEVGAPYQAKIIEYGEMMKGSQYLAINPMGKVPAIEHRGAVVTECAAICAYLADAFPDAQMAPPPGERQSYYRWLFFAAGPMEAAMTDKALGVEIPEERKPTVGYGEFGLVLDVLEEMLSRCEYVAGEHISAADVYLGAQLAFGLQFDSIEKRDAFTAYVKRLTGREAWQRANELDGPMG